MRGKYITQTHLDGIYEHALFVQSGTHKHFHWIIIAVLTQ